MKAGPTVPAPPGQHDVRPGLDRATSALSRCRRSAAAAPAARAAATAALCARPAALAAPAGGAFWSAPARALGGRPSPAGGGLARGSARGFLGGLLAPWLLSTAAAGAGAAAATPSRGGALSRRALGRVVGSAEDGWAEEELLPADRRLQHHPPVGVDERGRALLEVARRRGAGLDQHRRRVGGKRVLALLEALERLGSFEGDDLAERLPADLHADRELRDAGVADELAPLVDLALAVRAADHGGGLADRGEHDVGVRALEQVAQSGVLLVQARQRALDVLVERVDRFLFLAERGAEFGGEACEWRH